MRRVDASRVCALVILLALVACTTEPAQVDPNVMTAPLSASEHEAEIEQAMAVTPLPEGANWRPIEVDENGSYGVYAGAAMIEFQAACAWLAEALESQEANDPVRVTAAHGVVRQIPRWRGFSDPAFADQSLQDLIADVVEAALQSERQPMIRFLKSNCR